MKSCLCTLPTHPHSSPCPADLDSPKTTVINVSNSKNVFSSIEEVCLPSSLMQHNLATFVISQATDKTHDIFATNMSSKKRSCSVPVFISKTLITQGADCNVMADSPSQTSPQPQSKVSFDLFDEELYNNLPQALPSNPLCDYLRPSTGSSNFSSSVAASFLLPTKPTVHGLTGSRSQNDLPDYALLKRPCSGEC